MPKVNIVLETVSHHSNEEVVEYLDSLMTGVLKNYREAMNSHSPELLYGNIGDIVLASSIIRELKRRNNARQNLQGEL